MSKENKNIYELNMKWNWLIMKHHVSGYISDGFESEYFPSVFPGYGYESGYDFKLPDTDPDIIQFVS